MISPSNRLSSNNLTSWNLQCDQMVTDSGFKRIGYSLVTNGHFSSPSDAKGAQIGPKRPKMGQICPKMPKRGLDVPMKPKMDQLGPKMQKKVLDRPKWAPKARNNLKIGPKRP